MPKLLLLDSNALKEYSWVKLSISPVSVYSSLEGMAQLPQEWSAIEVICLKS